MPIWSDGRIRAENDKGGELNQAISRYFEKMREENLLMYRWDNEALRKDIEESKLKINAAGA